MHDLSIRPGGGADPRLVRGQETPGQVFAVLSRACLTAAIFSSEPLLTWVDSQPNTAITPVLHTVAESWNSAMTAIGADRPYRALHALLRAIEPPAP